MNKLIKGECEASIEKRAKYIWYSMTMAVQAASEDQS